MRTLSTKEDKFLANGKFSTHYQVKIEDQDAVMVDVTALYGVDWVKKCTYGENVDDPVLWADIDIWASSHNLSMVPLMETSKINYNVGGSYEPFLEANRAVEIYVAYAAFNETPEAGDYNLVFDGRIDEINVSKTKTNNTIKVRCRDLGGRLQDTIVEAVKRYGTDNTDGNTDYVVGPLEDLLQDFLDNWLSSPAVTLYSINGTGGTPFLAGDATSFSVTKWDIGIQSVMDALRLGANQIGWECRYRWQKNTDSFELHLFEPDRTTTTSLRTFGPDDYFDVTAHDLSTARIRNVVEITYWTDPDDDTSNLTQTSTDATSVAKYGRRWLGIVESASSAIDSSVEATLMADAILADLKEPERDQTIEMLYFYAAELGDLYTFAANNIHYTSSHKWAVVGVRHELSPTRTRTFLDTRGTPSGGIRHWWGKAQLPGIGTARRNKNPSKPLAVTLTANIDGLDIEWDELLEKRVMHYEVHASQSSGFTPGPTTLIARTRASRYRGFLTPDGDPYYIKVLAVDFAGNISAASTQVNEKSGAFGGVIVGSLDPDLNPGVQVLFGDEVYRRMLTSYDDLILDESPYFYLKLDETVGTVANDESANNRDFDFKNTPTLGATALLSDGGFSTDFANATECLYKAHSANSFTSLSMEFWINASSLAAEQHLFNFLNSVNNDEFQMWKPAGANSNLRAFVNNNLYIFVNKASIILSGNTHHVGITWDNSSGDLLIYVDGEVRFTAVSVEIGQTLSLNKFVIAAETDDGGGTYVNSIQGQMDNIALYQNKVLTEAEFLTRYNRGVSEQADFELVPSL